MKAVLFAPRALADLESIADYIANDNPQRALSFVGELEKRCLALGRRPHIARAFPALGPDAHILPHKNYVILFRNRSRDILIVRIIHGARDILPLLADEKS